MFIQEKFIPRLTFNPWLAITGSVSNNPGPDYSKLTWFETAIQSKSRNVTRNVVLVSGYLVLTGVN